MNYETEEVVVNNRILAVVGGDCDTPITFVVSVHTGCETCEEVSTCPMLAEANRYSVIKKKGGTEEKGTSEMEETKKSRAEEANPKLRLIRNTPLH